MRAVAVGVHGIRERLGSGGLGRVDAVGPAAGVGHKRAVLGEVDHVGGERGVGVVDAGVDHCDHGRVGAVGDGVVHACGDVDVEGVVGVAHAGRGAQVPLQVGEVGGFGTIERRRIAVGLGLRVRLGDRFVGLRVVDVGRALGDHLVGLGEQDVVERRGALDRLGGVERGAGDQIDLLEGRLLLVGGAAPAARPSGYSSLPR